MYVQNRKIWGDKKKETQIEMTATYEMVTISSYRILNKYPMPVQYTEYTQTET